PVLGDAAAWSVPRQEFRQHGLALDRHRRGARTLPRRTAGAARRRPAPAELSLGREGPALGRLRHRARSAAVDAADSPEGARTAPHVAQQYAGPVLDRGATR